MQFQWEKFKSLLDEPNLSSLLRAHWDELGVHKEEMPLDPDIHRFLMLEQEGIFKSWTARDDDGLLAGYVGWFIQPHIHYRKTLTALEDLYFLAPAYRRGLVGYRMLTTAIDALHDLGVKRVICHAKVHFEGDRDAHGGLHKLFLRLGFEHTDQVYSMMLKEA